MEVAMTRRSHRTSIAITAVALLLPNAAGAQAPTGPPCGDRASVVRNLHHGFGEFLVGYGLANTGTITEIYASRSGTWTIIGTNAKGFSCLIASGEAWEQAPPPLHVKED
jgi:hypothetical protein